MELYLEVLEPLDYLAKYLVHVVMSGAGKYSR